MIEISVDEEVFRYLQERAKPLVDTPNSVLRRLLLEPTASEPVKAEVPTMPTPARARALGELRGTPRADSESFVRAVLRQEFGDQFRQCRGFQMLFESDRAIVYFQNFNKAGTTNLWYRLNPSALRQLRSAKKPAFVCLTNPAEGYAYVVPMGEIDKRARASGWSRPELEVNIDPANSRWREFDWRLDEYRKVLRA